MAGALVLYISRRFVGTGNIVVNSMTRVDIPVLKDIPVIGKLFLTDTYPTTWFVLAILIVSWFVIERTPFGLRAALLRRIPRGGRRRGHQRRAHPLRGRAAVQAHARDWAARSTR